MRKTIIALTLCLLLVGTVAATAAVTAQVYNPNNNGRYNPNNNGRYNPNNNRYNPNYNRYNPNYVGPYNGQWQYSLPLYGYEANNNNNYLGQIGTIYFGANGYFTASVQGLPYNYNGHTCYLTAYNGLGYNGPWSTNPWTANGGYNLGTYTVSGGSAYVTGTLNTGLLPNAINQCTYCLWLD